MKNNRFNIIIVVISFCIFFSFVFTHQGAGAMLDNIRGLRLPWIGMAACLLILSWFFEIIVLYIVLKDSQHARNPLLRAFKLQMIGQFFAAISPFSAGSHPAQLFAMKKSGIPVGEAGSMLMIKFMIHQIINILLFATSIILTYHYFEKKIHYFTYLCGVGLMVHGGVLFFTLLVLTNKSLTKRIFQMCLRFLGQVKIVKNPEASYQKLSHELERFHANSKILSQKLRVCFYASIFTCLQYGAYFTIPYCIYRSFGLHSAELWTLLCAQTFLFNFMAAIPLPGAVGGAEGGFYYIYSLYFPSPDILTALLVWRLFSYYAVIAFSCIFALSWTRTKDPVTEIQH
ncbi:lysylphosphatidylglycerol synthase transmembrane domain-containing protein [Paenibacillus albus]|uniref:Phosphatidylglycerol lysyltransferase n=1 Tax=Paenibacillus albus TaxID=2495582 RepID=A0A3S9A5Y5_9BACL|nr:lysylphosphatidylglycerol synthase transmembrane domain-containing protein [Paenibacillus albus]AZN41113.1 flippase-like domain-containing protein [Paenibacillus albus]